MMVHSYSFYAYVVCDIYIYSIHRVKNVLGVGAVIFPCEPCRVTLRRTRQGYRKTIIFHGNVMDAEGGLASLFGLIFIGLFLLACLLPALFLSPRCV